MIKGKEARTLLILAIAAAVAWLLWWTANSLSNGRSGSDPNPFAYDLSSFRQIDSAWLRFDEADALDVGPAARALCAAGNGTVAVAVDRAVRFIRPDGTVTGELVFSGAVSCVAIGPRGTVYAGVGDHVERVSADDATVSEWVSLGERAILTAIAVGSNSVFVADAGQRAVWQFDREGRMQGRIDGAERDGHGGFIVPSPSFDVAWDPVSRTLLAADPGNQRVERFYADRVWAGGWGKASMGIEGFCGCCNPSQLAVLPDGRVVTAEKGLPRVKVYAADGVLDAVVAGPAQFQSEAGARDLAVDAAGRVLVLDAAAGKVRVFVERDT